MPNSCPSSFWSPDRHRDRRPFLLARARIVAALRRWFEAEGFLIVEPAALQVSPGNETHLHAFATEMIGPGGDRATRFLHTSPEFAMKKLLAAGEARIAAFAPVYRNRERSALHAPEFTMLEWYRVGAPYDAVMADAAAIVAEAARAARSSELTWRGRRADPFATAERLPVGEAFRRFADIDLLATIPEPAKLVSEAERINVRTAADDTWSDVFSRILSERIEPNLGIARPTLLCDYPAAEAALARVSPRDPRIAERFELYACGVELANGFAELTDPTEQRHRFEYEMNEKARIYGDRYPLDEDFLAALGHMPEASGVALGLDRLVMLATGAPHIDLVQWTPVDAGEEPR